jgi:hypothetical protein
MMVRCWQWLNGNSSAISAIAAVAGVFIAAVYAAVTIGIMRATKSQADSIQKQLQQLQKEHAERMAARVSVGFQMMIGRVQLTNSIEATFDVIVRNNGLTAARDFSLFVQDLYGGLFEFAFGDIDGLQTYSRRVVCHPSETQLANWSGSAQVNRPIEIEFRWRHDEKRESGKFAHTASDSEKSYLLDRSRNQ